MPLYLPCLNPKPLVEKSMGEEEEEEEQNREAGSKSRAKNLREIRDLLGLWKPKVRARSNGCFAFQ